MNAKYILGLLLTAGAAFGLGWVAKPNNDSAGGAGADSAGLSANGGSLVPGPIRSAEQVAADRAIEAAAATEEPFITKYLKNGVLTPKTMARAMEELLNESDPIKMNQMMAELLGRMTKETAPVAMAAIQKLGTRDPSQFYLTSLFANSWGRLDGEKALEFTQGQSGRMSGMSTASALSGWALESPEEAMTWLDGQEDNTQKMFYTAGLINGLAKSDPESATEYLEKVPGDNRMKGRYVEIIATEQMKKGIMEATSWADGLKDDGLKSEAFEDLANRYSQEDPAKAADWISGRVDEPWAKDAIAEVADEWAERDPAAAVEWANGLSGDAQNDAMSAALEEWTESDPAQASEYLAEMEASSVKDSAIVGFTERLSREDPESAVTWAATIGDEAIRNEALTDAARSWYRQDQEAAAAWLESSTLNEEARAKVVEPANQRGDFMRRFGGGDR
ncbi:MAG: hypothetical protein ABF370_04190 [Verrucomicrobiales bacterium]